MEYRTLGKTGWKVSALALGTVELGLDYGFTGSAHYQRPSREDAIRVVRRAVELGINLIDTARAYGDAEEIIGQAVEGVDPQPLIATKFALPADASDPRQVIESSVETSLRLLRRERLDLLQIHNATEAVLGMDAVLRTLEDLRRAGKIAAAGASIYGEASALRALETPPIATVQVPFNVLDQKLTQHFFPLAIERGAGVLVRSAFLRGVLTDRVLEVPDRLALLRDRALEAARLAGEPISNLAEVALRYTLSVAGVSSVIVGVRTVEELERNVRAAEKGPMPPDFAAAAARLAVDDENLVHPGNWTGLI